MECHAAFQSYGILVHVSAGYLPVRGWLHTCYSPVRRSPPVYRYTVLPLDLHVLSLSLAFILSQDQTLHCKILYRNLFWPGHVYESRLASISIHARYVVIFTSILLKNSSSLSRRQRFFEAKADAKIKRFHVYFQIFLEVFSNFFSPLPFNRESRLEDRRQHDKNAAYP